MYQFVTKSIENSECRKNRSYTEDLINTGDKIYFNIKFGTNYKIDRFKAIKSKNLLRFSDNLLVERILNSNKVNYN